MKTAAQTCTVQRRYSQYSRFALSLPDLYRTGLSLESGTGQDSPPETTPKDPHRGLL